MSGTTILNNELNVAQQGSLMIALSSLDVSEKGGKKAPMVTTVTVPSQDHEFLDTTYPDESN